MHFAESNFSLFLYRIEFIKKQIDIFANLGINYDVSIFEANRIDILKSIYGNLDSEILFKLKADQSPHFTKLCQLSIGLKEKRKDPSLGELLNKITEFQVHF